MKERYLFKEKLKELKGEQYVRFNYNLVYVDHDFNFEL